MKFVAGLVVGIALNIGGVGVYAQNERDLHPRIAAAISALRDARDYMAKAPHDFAGHKEAAIRASDEAIRQLEMALRYRGREDRR